MVLRQAQQDCDGEAHRIAAAHPFPMRLEVSRPGTPHRDLEGPIFGDRVGIYHATSEDGPLICGKSSQSEYQLTLYKTEDYFQSGLASAADSEDDIKTLPRKVRKALGSKLEQDAQTFPEVYTLSSIPADGILQGPEARDGKNDRMRSRLAGIGSS